MYSQGPLTPGAARTKGSPLGEILSGIASGFRSRRSRSGATNSGTSLPVHKGGESGDPYGCPETTSASNIQASTPADSRLGGSAQHHFLLLCLPFMRWGTKLHQSEVCRVNSDRDFFRLLRERYYTARKTRGIVPGLSLWLQRPRFIEFVRLEVFASSDMASIQSKPALPTMAHRDDYHYEPMPYETLPPVGPNVLMHFFEHPSHAEVVPVLYRRVPKKLRARLAACPRAGSAVGWGMELTEGLDPFLVFACGCAAFGVALAVAIVWIALRREDVQGAFAISGFILAFAMFCLHVGGLAT